MERDILKGYKDKRSRITSKHHFTIKLGIFSFCFLPWDGGGWFPWDGGGWFPWDGGSWFPWDGDGWFPWDGWLVPLGWVVFGWSVYVLFENTFIRIGSKHIVFRTTLRNLKGDIFGKNGYRIVLIKFVTHDIARALYLSIFVSIH